jgi:hypothetical protein
MLTPVVEQGAVKVVETKRKSNMDVWPDVSLQLFDSANPQRRWNGRFSKTRNIIHCDVSSAAYCSH